MADTESVSGRRTKSQVSVFDYPEHLNPFYEDDNHKRLRFWKIGKNKDGSSSRRGSFSLGGLREMWTFKSLRGKKKSSTLGINKTSESPEPLRRIPGAASDTMYATYDPKYRNTYDNAALNSNFQRNVPYRTSLQDMSYAKGITSNGNGIGLNRNDNYRSTIQVTGRRNNNNYSPGYDALSPTVPPRRYVYAGSVTPQPRTRYDHNSSSQGIISRGSSQYSIASSANPFEDEDDTDITITGRLSSADSERPTPSKRHVRKKRRAPPPPVPIPKIIDEESSGSIPTSPTHSMVVAVTSITTPPSTPTDETSQNDNFENQLQRQMQMVEDVSELETLEISNITAEIEHYVKLLSQDEEDDSSIRLISGSTPVTPVALKKSKSSNSIEKNSPLQIKKSESAVFVRSVERKTVGPFSPRRNSEAPQKVASRIHRGSFKTDSGTPEKSVFMTKPFIVTRSASKETGKEALPARDQSSTDSEDSASNTVANSPHKKLANGFLQNRSEEENNNFNDHPSAFSKEQTPLNSSYDTMTTTTTTTTEESSSIPPNIELKITESKEDLSDQSNGSSSDRYQIKYVPLKEGTPESPVQLRHEFKPNNSFQPAVPQPSLVATSQVSANPQCGPAEPESRKSSFSSDRRRSVKEIIESINRSQSLLKVNQEPQKTSSASITTPTFITSANVNNLNGGGSVPIAAPRSSPPRQRSEPKDSTIPLPRSSELDESYRQLSQSEHEIRRMLVEMENLTDGREADAYCENVPSILARFDEEVNNNDIFKKCVLKKQWIREGSPTTSNLDWNPVPKPKRSKNLSAELNNNNNNNKNNGN